MRPDPLLAALILLVASPALAQEPPQGPDAQAEALVGQMTLQEQLGLVHGVVPYQVRPMPEGALHSAGFVPGLPRLNIPALTESDASLGVANAGRANDDATPLPSGLLLASTFSPELAFEGGAMVGKEARQKGFNVLLGGGVNLMRDPRNGRNFEYLGEDPLLAGVLDGAAIRGVQSQHVIDTAKHYVINDQETGRQILDARIEEGALRESDLLAFELAIEQGRPGSVMCAYNRINGTYACEHDHLLNEVLKQDWGYPGWVMSDWGAVHSVGAAVAGLDQESGEQFDSQVFFGAPLAAAVASGQVPQARIRDMVRRIVRSMIAVGLTHHPLRPGGLDTAADAEVSARVAEQGIVLLKASPGLLPLAATARKIVVIGGHADVGVLSGGGSSQTIPTGSVRFPPPKGAPGWSAGMFFHPSPPLAAIRARAGGADISFNDGADPAAAAALAKDADVAIVFATQWAAEGFDTALTLEGAQDALIAAVAAANPHTVVVLETANPVLMPWSGKVGAIVEAWFPGAKGGESIAKVLFGEVNPSGRLPASFPAAADQLPRPELPGAKDWVPEGVRGARPPPFAVDYPEGSDVGYRWYVHTGRRPAFPFGLGLSYTRFRYSDLKVSGGRTVTASFTVTNTGDREGIDTPQVYLAREPARSQQRLIGWSRVALKPGEHRRVTLTADPRLLASWDEAAHGWRVDPGRYQVFLGTDALTPSLWGSASVAAAKLKP